MPFIFDGNKVLESSVEDIIGLLQAELYTRHIDKLRSVSFRQSDAKVSCPIHKDGMENNPSCHILLHDKPDGTVAGTVHCFACGYKANLIRFVADCLSVSYRAATEWMLDNAAYTIMEDYREFNPYPPEVYCNYAELPVITCEQLEQYDYIHPYMFKRKLTDEVIDRFEVGYYPEEKCLTFPVYANDRCLFVAKRKTDYKKFIMPSVVPKPIYGLPYVKGSSVVVCESIINCLTCYVYGKEAIALFGTGSKAQYDMLKTSGIRAFYLALDGDEAGRKGIKRFAENRPPNAFVYVMKLPDGKDINDLSKEEFEYVYNSAEMI